MTSDLRKKLFDRLMVGAIEESKGDNNVLDALEQGTHEDLDAIEPIIDAAIQSAGIELTLDALCNAHVERVLAACNGNRSLASTRLGIGRTSLYRYFEKRANLETHIPKG